MSVIPGVFNQQVAVPHHQLLPRVYNIKKSPDKVYYVEQYKLFYETPKKLYGSILKNANHFWKAYTNSLTSMGVMLVGASGAGKTIMSDLLSNIAISNNMPVVIVSNLEADIELIRYLDSLGDVMIVMDEFAKVFNYTLQEKMLTMLSSLGGGKKFFIITENNPRHISEYIRDRPGRMRYRIDFGRVTLDVVNEYCGDHNVRPEFMTGLIEKYNESLVFSFDHLKAIVQEHVENPDTSFIDTINILNLEVLSKPVYLYIRSIHDIIDDKEIKFVERSISKSKFENGDMLYVNLSDNHLNIRIKNKDVISVIDDQITCLVEKKYKVILSKG